MNKVSLVAAVLMGITFGGSAMSAPDDAASDWQTVATAQFRVLWKTLTWAELSVDPIERTPIDILDASYSKALQIQYGVDVSADRLRMLAWESINDGWSASQIAEHKSTLDAFFAAFRDVEKGDVYKLRWRPQVGLELLLNETKLSRVQDADVATMILSIWLGPAAVSEKQRQTLLEQWRNTVGSAMASSQEIA